MDTDKLVFLDEAGVSLALSYNYGWAPPGVVPVIERPARGNNITLIGAIGLGGVRALRRVEKSVDGVEFLAFLREDLIPVLEPGTTVIMDGPRLHRMPAVAELLEAADCSVLYLPAYSPELNPIEMAWAWVKKKLRAIAARKVRALRESIEKAWNTITPELCTGWTRHCGYPTQST